MRTAEIATRIYGTRPSARRLKFALTNSAPSDGIARDEMVAFCPMEAVGDHGELDTSQTRRYEEVASGYTRFANGDVLVAKITAYTFIRSDSDGAGSTRGAITC